MQSRSIRLPVSVLSASVLFLSLSSCFFGKKEDPVPAKLRQCSSDELRSAVGGASGKDDRMLAEEIGRLTQRILVASDRYNEKTKPSQRILLLAQILGLVNERADLMATLIKSSPDEFIQASIPSELRARIPLEATACLEHPVTENGEIRVIMVEGAAAQSEYDTVLSTSDGRSLSLRFQGKHPGLQTGSLVLVKGIVLPCARGSTLPMGVRSQPDSVVDLSATAGIAPRTFGPQSTVAILLNFQDEAASSSLADVQNVVFGQVNDYLLETSNNQAWLTGRAVGPYTIPVPSSSCDYGAISSAARTAATHAGVNLSQYAHYIYVFPRSSCGWLGLGTIGGFPSEAWIHNSLTLHTVAHEFGHNLGLFHSNAWSCGGSVIGGSCTSLEYQDTTDIMGNRVPGHYNAFQKERLGWLNYGLSPAITTIDQSGAYLLPAYESSGTDPKALKVLQSVASDGSKNYFYLEYRQALGFDSVFSTLLNISNLTRGLIIHTGNSANGNSSELLQMNPQTGSWFQAALNVGQSFLDSSTQTRITLDSADSSSAAVAIQLGNGRQGCAKADPTLVLSPTRSDWTAAGTQVAFTATLSNGDSESCDSGDFRVDFTAPPGWSVDQSSTTLSLTPQNSGNAVVELSSPVDAVSGSYALEASVTREGDASAAASMRSYYLVLPQSGSELVVTSGRAVYALGDEVDLRIDAASAGSALSGADYSLILTRPDGSQLTWSGQTETNGSASLAFHVSECGQRGTYLLQATVRVGGTPLTSQGSFEVQ